jgi:hypothetical protein
LSSHIYNGEAGRVIDPDGPGVMVHCGPRNGKAARLVVLQAHDGKEHRGEFNTNSDFQREQFLARAAVQFECSPEDLAHLDAEIVRAADAEDQRAENQNRVGRPVIVRMDKVISKPVDWLWDKKIARGKLTLWVGDPGVGKSVASTNLAARVSAGLGFPDGSSSGPPAGVVLISAEDGAEDTIKPRLEVAGADPPRIVLVKSVTWFDEHLGLTERQLYLQRDIPALEEAIQQTPDCALVIVDPIASYMGKSDSHKNAEVRAVLTPVAKLAEKYNLAVLGITHLNKSTARAMDRVTGSLAFVAQARAVWVVGRDRHDQERRLVACLKNNLAKDTLGMAYRLVDAGGYPRVEWEPDPVDVRADDLLAPERADAPAREGKRREADEWLRGLLAGGPMGATSVRAEADGAGVPWAAVRAAANRLGIVPYRKGGRDGAWWWVLPQRCEGSPSQNVSTFDTFSTFGDEGER